jgi:hypothetical protein
MSPDSDHCSRGAELRVQDVQYSGQATVRLLAL